MAPAAKKRPSPNWTQKFNEERKLKKQLDEWKVKDKDRVVQDLAERVYNLPREPIHDILADPEKCTVYKVTNGGEILCRFYYIFACLSTIYCH